MFGNDTVMEKGVGINIEMDDVITGFWNQTLIR